MTRSSVRGDGVPGAGSGHAGEDGWNESLYEGGGRRRARRVEGGSDDDPPGISRAARRREGKSPRKQVLKWSAVALSVAVLATAGAGYLWYEGLNSRLDKAPLTLGGKQMAEHKANAAGQTPINILLIGSDDRNTAANLKLGGHKESVGAKPLADVQMLLHLSADRTHISVVSMPRDTLIPLPRCTDPESGVVYEARELGVTNETLGRGGPGCTVATWNEFTGITIDHFMMIDFAGVVSMADAVGGVPVCVSGNIKSRTRDGKGSGLKLKKGETFIKGEQALQWLRTRYGFGDGSDVNRTKAQHMYMNSLIRQLRENATITNPTKLKRLADKAMDAFIVDEGIDGVLGLLDLAEELRKVDPKRISMTTMPNFYSERGGIYSGKVEPVPGDAEDLFEMIREDVPLEGKAAKRKPVEVKDSDDPAADASEITVQVLNGTRTASEGPAQGRANEVVGLLQRKGYARAEADAAVARQSRTTITFPSADLEGDAQAVAKAVGLPLSAVRGSEEASSVTLTIGADWRTGEEYTAPKAKKAPKSATLLNGAKKECMPVNPDYGW